MAKYIFTRNKEPRRFGLLVDFLLKLDEPTLELVKKYPLDKLYKLREGNLTGVIRGFHRPPKEKGEEPNVMFCIVGSQNPSMDPDLDGHIMLIPLSQIEEATLLSKNLATKEGMWVRYVH